MSAAAAPAGLAAPTCGFIGWGPECAAMLTLLRRRFPEVESRAVALSSGPAAAPLTRTLPSLEALLQAATLLFVEGGPAALAPHLPMLRLAISDRHVLVLLGRGWSLQAMLAHLKERKLVRCVLLPAGPGQAGTLVYHAAPYFTPEERAAFRALFAHLELCVELQEERQFEVLQGLTDFAPAAFYTVLEAMADGVVMMGFSRSAAVQLLASLLHGAVQRVLTGDQTAAQLREQALEVDVAAAGLIELESAGIRGTLMRAIQRAVRRPRTADSVTPDEPS